MPTVALTPQTGTADIRGASAPAAPESELLAKVAERLAAFHVNGAEWSGALTVTVQKLTPVERQNFLLALQSYLNGEIPPASQFRGLDTGLRSSLSGWTGRSQLWTAEAVQDCADRLAPAIERACKRTGHEPVIVEVAGGLGDLSYGLSRALPGIQVIPTDIEGLSLQGKSCGSLHEPIVRARGVRRLSAEDLMSEEIRALLLGSSADPREILVVASHLPPGRGTERALLTQRVSHELLIVKSFVGTRGPSGGSSVRSDPECWNATYSLPNQRNWLNGFGEFDQVSSGWNRGSSLQIHQYSRVREEIERPSRKGAVAEPCSNPSDISNPERLVDWFRAHSAFKWRNETSPGRYWPYVLGYNVSPNKAHEIRQLCRLATAIGRNNRDADQEQDWTNGLNNIELRIERQREYGR